jgi:Uma2 family endonuclease
MVSTRPKGKYTYADYAAKPDDERWELVDGVLYQMAPAPSVKHQIATKNLGRLIDAPVIVRNLGLLLYAPTDVILSDQTTVQPDILYVSADRFHIITEQACEGPPDLVVEVLSPSNTSRDLEIKRELYARYGVPQYLIVDADAETVRALAEPIIDGNVGVYVNEAVFYPGDTMQFAVIPGLRIAVLDIFASPL